MRRIRALRDEVGDFGTLLVIGHEWEPREAWTRSMRLLVEDVLRGCDPNDEETIP